MRVFTLPYMSESIWLTVVKIDLKIILHVPCLANCMFYRIENRFRDLF